MKSEFILESMKILYVIALFQALLIVVYLLFQGKGNANSRQVLALLLIDFCIFLTGTFFLLFPRFYELRYLAHLASTTVFLAPPLLFFYYQSLTNISFRFSSTMIKHAIPFLLIFLVMVYEIAFQSNHLFLFHPFGIALLSILFAQNILYLHFISKQELDAAFKKSGNIRTKWLRILFQCVFFVFVFKLITFILWNVFGFIKICMLFTGLFFILSFIIINILVLFGLFNPEILSHYVKYQNSSIDKKKNDRCYKNLLELIVEKELYKDSLLSLLRLSRQLNVSEKQLSQIINENAGTNFNDFVNGYRIKEAQRLISCKEKETINILQIAYEVGFNSKSTFNSSFKKFTNVTPSEFRKRNQKSD